MDDLTSKISQILGDPEAMEQIKGLAGLLGTENPELSNFDESIEINEDKKPDNDEMSSFMSGNMLNIFLKIMPLLNDLNKEDDSTKLLKAIRPFLSPPRQKKLDEALNILKIIKFLPLLKDGFLS